MRCSQGLVRERRVVVGGGLELGCERWAGCQQRSRGRPVCALASAGLLMLAYLRTVIAFLVHNTFKRANPAVAEREKPPRGRFGSDSAECWRGARY
jgi:hypothetical protein